MFNIKILYTHSILILKTLYEKDKQKQLLVQQLQSLVQGKFLVRIMILAIQSLKNLVVVNVDIPAHNAAVINLTLDLDSDSDCGYNWGGVNYNWSESSDGDFDIEDYDDSDMDSLEELEGEELEANLSKLRAELKDLAAPTKYEQITEPKLVKEWKKIEQTCTLGYTGHSQCTQEWRAKDACNRKASHVEAQTS